MKNFNKKSAAVIAPFFEIARCAAAADGLRAPSLGPPLAPPGCPRAASSTPSEQQQPMRVHPGQHDRGVRAENYIRAASTSDVAASCRLVPPWRGACHAVPCGLSATWWCHATQISIPAAATASTQHVCPQHVCPNYDSSQPLSRASWAAFAGYRSCVLCM